ncbi:MAG: GTPase ObgE, partial [Verrucomicrobiota bacterium]
MKTITFKDRVKLYIKSGHGGDGCVSFRREKFVPRGGPDGGDGGHGGSVYLVADANADSLLDLYYRPHQKAEHGGAGRNKQCHGKNGKDLHLKVPCGTVAFNESSDQRLGEVLEPGDTLLVAKGGRGGKGNIHFATSTHQAPTEFTHGTPGEDITAWLELKMVADAGLVGYPNAGKSTLIRELSGARPKVASYPFTTLNPIIGIVQFEDYRTLRVADIPGLIDGAHEGVGLGHDFLRHIERCPFLIFVLDMGGVDGRDPTEDFLNLRDELKKYQADLDDRPYIVVANKMDLEDSEDH